MPFLLLFTSFSTLICCALPMLLVSIGLGASLVGLFTEFPQLIWLSENKNIVFAFTVFMMTASGLWIYKQRNAPCPIDPKLRHACLRGRKWSFYSWMASVGISLVGFFFAYLLPLMSA